MARSRRSEAKDPPPALGFPTALATMDRALRLGCWARTHSGGPRWPVGRPVDRQLLVLPVPRLTVILDGSARYGLSVGGERVVVEGGPGTVFHFARHAWNAAFWATPVRFIGIVFHRDYLRVLWCDHPGGANRSTSRVAHHTREPVGAACRAVLDALDAIADAPTADLQPTVGGLARAAWQLARCHLAADLDSPAVTGARRTWQDCVAWLTEHLDQPIGRDDVARVLKVHPNYLSTLCSAHGGHGFQRTLEDLRLDRAKDLLRREPDLGLDAIARRCGFADGDYLGRVFRQRLGITPRRWARS